MILKNAVFYNSAFVPVKADILIDGERIADTGEFFGADCLDLEGCTILPGFIDIHIHGSAGADMQDAKAESLNTISRHLAKNGITSFCPATMTLPEEALTEQFKACAAFMGHEEGAYIHGINMEGPFIAMSRKGAQPADYVRLPDIEEFRRLSKLCTVKLVDLAPELEGACEFAREASKTCAVSAAHTDATYEEAAKGFENGFTHATHLYSAMPPIENRRPGCVTAVFDNDKITAELICDGLHAHPPILRMSFKLLKDRAVVVSDAMKGAGLGDGEFDLGGQKVFVKDGKATLADGTFAASTVNLYQEFRRLLNFGIPFADVVKACTITPAKVIGVDGETGSIQKGKFADLLVLDSELEIKAVFIKGRRFV